ncbi:TPA: Rha family transcriptional regulator [Shewanella algae]|uniref:Rha family transcriptional regulator n=1 Tax=Shewanella algae TaxID=38313 RepID=UPI001C55D907|nr:Rha family transcriptional regulator [Shewanella algae]HDS1203082.1 Rha family transcriptional regulator [Shewanella algae]
MNKANTIPSLNHLVCAQDGALITTSINVAEAFGKRHDDVLRKIKVLDCSDNFNARNFTGVEYLDAKGEKRPMWQMTKDGFMFLVMGFTGKKAAAIKEAYINAFNWMAEQLSGASRQKTTTDDRTGLRNAVNLLVSKKGLMYPDAYAMVHQRFNVEHLDQLEKSQLTEAIEYVHKLAIEGELLPRESHPEGFSITREQASAICHMLHHVSWVYFRWHQGIAQGLSALNRTLYANTFEHVESMARTGMSLDRELGHMRVRLDRGSKRPDELF